MRWLLSEVGKVLRTLFLWALLFVAAGIALFMGADVYLSSKYFASPLVQQFDYASRKTIDATPLLKAYLPEDDLREYRLEQVLQGAHGFKCQPVSGVSRCLYIKRGLLNCAHSIGLDLKFDGQHRLTSAAGDSFAGCS